MSLQLLPDLGNESFKEEAREGGEDERPLSLLYGMPISHFSPQGSRIFVEKEMKECKGWSWLASRKLLSSLSKYRAATHRNS